MVHFAFVLLGQEPSVSAQAVNWAQLITSGGFAALAWYLVCVYIPRITRDYKEEIAAERTSRTEERKDFIVRMREQEAGCAAERRAVLEELGRFRDVLQLVHEEVKNRG
jgi:hypothetical protein